MIGRMFHRMFLPFLILLQTSSILSIVLELNQTTFDEHVFTKPLSDHWFITFYAPWCEHCKKLYPVLDELSSYLEMKNTNEKDYPKVTVAKINAPKNREIADRYGIDKFPRILYKKDNITGIYDGPRSLQGFQLFLDRFNDPIYQIIEGREEGEFKVPSIHPYHNVTFILQLYCSLDETNTQSATNVPPCSSKTKTLYSAFERVATQLHLHTTLAVVHHSDVTAVPTSTKDSKSKKTPIKPEATFCKFSSRHIPFGKDMFDSGEHQIISHDDELYCVPDLLPTTTPTTATTPSTTATTEDDLTEKLATFIQRNNYPFMNIFENHNFKILSHLNKTMIIGIIDERKDISAKAILTQLKATYLQIIDSHPDRHDTFYEQYIVGYLDGKKWKQFVRHHDAFVPSILIIDHQDERHAVMKLPPSAKATEKYGPLIKKVLISLMVDETIEMSETIPPGIVRKMMHRFKKYFPYSILVIALPSLFLIMALKFFPFPQRRKAKKQ